MHAPLLPAHTTRIAECRHGRFTFRSDDVYIGRSLDLYGEYSEGEVELFRKYVNGGSIVIEVGANIGTLTVPLARLASRVIAIEAQPANASMLERNITDNGLTNVTVIDKAAGARPGATKMRALDDLASKNFGGIAVGAGDLNVEVITLDSLDVLYVSFIKIDVEGAERDVLLGARALIERDKPVLYVENDRREKSAELITLLTELGYRLFWHKPPLFNPSNFRGHPDNVFGAIVSLNMLCLHKDDPDLEGVKLAPVMPPAPLIRREKWACVARLGGVGDNLTAASHLNLLKRKGYKVEVITAEPGDVVFLNHPAIDKLAVKKPKDLPQNDISAWQRWFAARANEYEFFVNLSHSWETFVSLVPAQGQFWWPEKVRRKLCDRSYIELVHDVCDVPHEFGPLFFPTDAERRRAEVTKAKVGQHVIGWVISGSRVDKMYPHQPTAIARILAEFGLPVIMFGHGARDFQVAKQTMWFVEHHNGSSEGLHSAISPEVENATDRHGAPLLEWDVRRSITQLMACDLVIGPDTGLMWGAAFEAMPKILMLGHSSPENITKHWPNTITLHPDQNRVPCWPCHRLNDSFETCTPSADGRAAACMADITVDRLMRAVGSFLRHNGS
jgi:FkbM family methyltransferase